MEASNFYISISIDNPKDKINYTCVLVITDEQSVGFLNSENIPKEV